MSATEPAHGQDNPHDERLDEQPEDENAPLLPREDQDPEDQAAAGEAQSSRSSASSLLRRLQGNSNGKSRSRRWPSVLALVVLILVGLSILIGGFFAPEIGREYAQQAVFFEPTTLSIDSFSETGINARIQGDFVIDASRVQRKPVRDLGRFGTWLFGSAQIGHTLVLVSLPEYGDVLLGTADVPSIQVDLRDGKSTHIDFVTHVEPGEKDAVRRLANDWIDGSIGDLRVKGEADVPIRTGFFQIGGRHIEQTLVFESSRIPAIPAYSIKTLNFTEVDLPNGGNAISAEVTIRVDNQYPVELEIPPLGFTVLVDNCLPTDPLIMVADANTHSIQVRPKKHVDVTVNAFIKRLPKSFLAECPGSSPSPFDNLLAKYLHGEKTTAYVRGSSSPSADTPAWISELMQGVTVPVTVPGHPMKNLIKKFSMEDVRFSLPDFFSEPGTPDAQPKISAKIDAIIALPEEMNFNIDVHRIRSNATVYHEKQELGLLDLKEWHQAKSRKVTLPGSEHADLEVVSAVERAPLFITNQSVFEDVVSALLTGEKLDLSVVADVDVEVQTALGTFVAHKIPAKGKVPVQPIGGGGDGHHGGIPDFDSIMPRISDLRITNTTETSMTLGASVNFTNPTKYSAEVSYFDLNVLVNDTIVGHATVRDAEVKSGNNSNVLVEAVWDPWAVNGTEGAAVGREALSQYLSGYNLTLSVQTHARTIPSQPNIGTALSKYKITFPVPDLGGSDPGDGDGDGKKPGSGRHFIKDTTVHFFTSTATFVLDSPLKHTSLTITKLDANAFFKGDAVGSIFYDLPLEVPPGESETDRIPVDWDISSVGYDAIRRALGGTLRLSARATVDVMIGAWKEHVWFQGQGIGVKVRL